METRPFDWPELTSYSLRQNTVTWFRDASRRVLLICHFKLSSLQTPQPDMSDLDGGSSDYLDEDLDDFVVHDDDTPRSAKRRRVSARSERPRRALVLNFETTPVRLETPREVPWQQTASELAARRAARGIRLP